MYTLSDQLLDTLTFYFGRGSLDSSFDFYSILLQVVVTILLMLIVAIPMWLTYVNVGERGRLSVVHKEQLVDRLTGVVEVNEMLEQLRRDNPAWAVMVMSQLEGTIIESITDVERMIDQVIATQANERYRMERMLGKR